MDTPGTTTKRKITQFCHQTTAKINDGVVEPVRRADPGSSDVEFSDSKLLSPASPAGDECSAVQTVTLVKSPTLSDVASQPSSSSSASGAISDIGDLLKTVATTSRELELVVDTLTDEEKHHILTAHFRPSKVTNSLAPT